MGEAVSLLRGGGGGGGVPTSDYMIVVGLHFKWYTLYNYFCYNLLIVFKIFTFVHRVFPVAGC
jgi:hypothetical protein